MCFAILTKALVQLKMTAQNRSGNSLYARDLQRETHFDVDKLCGFVQTTQTQANTRKNGGLYLLNTPGSTGKIYLISLILATKRSGNDAVLAIASSGIGATLLDGGRTAQLLLKLP